MRPLRTLLLRNTIVSWLNYGLTVVLGLVITPIVIHSLGAGSYGAWILVLQLTGYAGLLDLGVQPAVTRMVAEALGRGDTERVRRVIGTAFVFHSSTAIAVMLLLVGVAPMLGTEARLEGVRPAEAVMALRIAAVAAAIGFPSAVFGAALKGALRLDLVGWANIVSQLTRAGTILLVLRLDGGVTGLALAALSASLAGAAVQFVALKLLPAILSFELRVFSGELLRAVARIGIYTLLGQGGWYLAYASNSVLVGFLLSSTDVAYYGVVGNAMALLSGVAGALSGNVMPLASSRFARGDLAGSQRTYLLSTRFTLVLVLPAVAVLVALGPDLMSLWLGPQFRRPSGTVLQILALAYLFPIAGASAPQVFLGIGLERRMARISLAEGILAIGLSYILIRNAGLVGGAVGTLMAASFIHGIVWTRAVSVRLGFPLARLWRDAVRPAAGPLLAALPVLTFGLLLRSHPTPVFVLVLAVLTFAIYWGVAWFTCFDAGERADWVRMLRRDSTSPDAGYRL